MVSWRKSFLWVSTDWEFCLVWKPVPVSPPSQQKSVFLYAGGIASTSICGHCLFSFQCVPLKAALFQLLYTPASANLYILIRFSLIFLFSSLKNLSFLHLSSDKRCSSSQSSPRPCARHTFVSLYLLCVGVPRTGHILQVWFYQCWLEVKDHLYWPAVNTFPNAARAEKLPCHTEMLLDYGHLAVLAKLFFSCSVTTIHWCMRLFLPRIGTWWSLCCLDVHGPSVVISPGFSCPSEISSIWCISHYSQFSIICKLAERALCPIIQVISDLSIFCSLPPDPYLIQSRALVFHSLLSLFERM